MRRGSVLAILLATTLACSGPFRGTRLLQGEFSDLAPRLERIDITSAGIERSAFVHVPADHDGTPRPMVIALHSADRLDVHGLQAARDWQDSLDQGVVFLFPNSVQHRKTDPWYGPDDATQALRDLVFFRDLIDVVEAEVDLNPRWIYLVGTGVGGEVALHASCADPEPYAAFATIDTVWPEALQACEPTIKRPAAAVFGSGVPREATTDWWIDQRGCFTEPVEVRTAENTPEGSVRGDVYRCRSSALEIWSVHDAERCRPGPCGGHRPDAWILDFWRRHAAP